MSSNSGDLLQPDASTPKFSPSTPQIRSLTPRSLKIIRLLAAGKSKMEVAKEIGTTYNYIYKLMASPLAKEEYRKIAARIETAAVHHIATAQSGVDPAVSTALTAEVDASVLEAIQKLRSIMNSPTTSPQAQSFAAKELLDLSQAKKRLALLDKGLEDGAEVSADDVRLLAATVGDLRLLHMVNMGPDRKAQALRHFSATEEEILSALPEEMSGSTPVDAPVEVDGSGTAALPTGPDSNAQGPIPIAPVISNVGPTLEELTGQQMTSEPDEPR